MNEWNLVRVMIAEGYLRNGLTLICVFKPLLLVLVILHAIKKANIGYKTNTGGRTIT